MEKRLYTPILFLVFNRPEKTLQTFNAIREVRPTKLYVAIDAPRENRPDDVENWRKVKEIVHNVDWECETHYLIREKNLGCTLSGKTAWDWFFEYEDRMIFVEDDGLGSPSAFYFTQELLEKYKDDNRIKTISPINYGVKHGKYSYFATRYMGGTYFMGTWKRVYDLYDYDLSTFKETTKNPIYKNSFFNWKEKSLFEMRCKQYVDSVKKGARNNTYDIQFEFLGYKYDMLCLVSNVSMVRNIGFDGGANTLQKNIEEMEDPYASFALDEIDEINHLPAINYDKKFDLSYYPKRNFEGSSWSKRYLKFLFLRYFGGVYKKIIKPIRYR